jgi:hypothetical protein
MNLQLFFRRDAVSGPHRDGESSTRSHFRVDRMHARTFFPLGVRVCTVRGKDSSSRVANTSAFVRAERSRIPSFLLLADEIVASTFLSFN